MKAIYEPRGRAREYAPLACNLYTGCSHGCRYCYAPAVLRKDRFDFIANVKPRPGILDAIKRDAAKLSLGPGPVLLCFTCDPYQPCEAEHALTRKTVEVLGKAGLGIRILTKAGTLPERDFHLFRRFDVEFGVTLCSLSEDFRAEWEPNARTVPERMRALRHAHDLGIRTWVSVEPVMSPAQVLHLIWVCMDFVDVWKIGKLNHDKAREAAIDWRQFLEDVLAALTRYDASYYIKQDLWDFADDSIRGAYFQRKGVPKE